MLNCVSRVVDFPNRQNYNTSIYYYVAKCLVEGLSLYSDCEEEKLRIFVYTYLPVCYFNEYLYEAPRYVLLPLR